MQTSQIKVASHRVCVCVYYKIYKKFKTTHKKKTFQNQLNLKFYNRKRNTSVCTKEPKFELKILMQCPWLMTYPFLPTWENCHTSFIQKERTWRACFYNTYITDQKQNNMANYFIFKERKWKHDPLNLPKRLLQMQRDFPRISLSPLGKAPFRSKATPYKIIRQGKRSNKGVNW